MNNQLKKIWKKNNPEYHKQYYLKNKKKRFCIKCDIEVGNYKRYCDECNKEIKRKNALNSYKKYKEERKNIHSEYSKEYRKNNPEKLILTRAKRRAKQLDQEFNLDIEDIHIPDICPVLKVPLKLNSYYSPSLDRIDNSKGYIKGNVQIISWKANVMKNSASIDELIKFAEWVFENYKGE